MSQIVLDGLNGAFYTTQGYGFAAITLNVSPYGPIVDPSATVVFTASVASSWSVSSGSLVVAGDNLSATWTAPGTPGTATLTVTDLSNPGNKITDPITISSTGPPSQGDIVPSTVGRSIIGHTIH